MISILLVQVLKSGHLLLSSKGIGWTSWKKRWFILTRSSLVFFRSDPNVPPPRGAEPIVTLGGIDLNSSGSVVVKEDRKLLTVFFPDGRDGRTFTLKMLQDKVLATFFNDPIISIQRNSLKMAGPFSTATCEPQVNWLWKSPIHWIAVYNLQLALVNG
ncbi:unnamed protein product [Miscanthus lutarioriparius]|uniref:PH domain-containing protein n=1 Tax=Miscanthus lutarioriparius TaxID=422564 RepID=A0A811S6E6_9POAL|nr:unnamed protein product [Miscanthus lutarioriparius]